MKNLAFSVLILFQSFSFAQTTKNFDWDGVNRQYIEYVSSAYSGSEPVPLVICLHGLGDNMSNFSGIGMHALADIDNFIVLTPQALMSYIGATEYGTAWNSGASYFGITLNGSVDDLGFFNAMIDSTIALYNIDSNRIYFTGFSMGGFMCHRVACEMNSRVAAIASVAGTIGNSMNSTPPAPMPVLHCHGTADSQVGYTGNNFGIDAEDLVAFWVNQNNCSTTPVVENIPDNIADGITVEKYLYENGDYSTEVEFYKAEGADHQWLYPPVNDMSYTLVIWEFFKRHSKESFVNTTEIDNSENFAVYPVPASDFLHISCNNKAVFELYSAEGKLIKKEDVFGKKQININEIESGVYFYRLYNSNKVISKKIIISK